MRFNVEYKDAAGALRRETVDAQSRAACFAGLRLKGIAPIKVTAERGAPKAGQGSQRPTIGRKTIAAVLCLVAALGAVLWMVSDTPGGQDGGVDAKPSARPPRKSIEFRPAEPARTTVVQPAPVRETPVAPEKPEPEETGRQSRADGWQMVNGFKVPKGARLVRNSLTNKQERVFATASDALIASYLQPPVHGTMAPPLPMTGDAGKRFLASLEVPVEIKDTDTEDVRRQKESVIIARAQIKDMMDRGYTFEEILAEHYRLAEENNKIRNAAQKELNAIYMSGDIDGAERYRRVMDAAMSQMGIDPLEEPMTREERREMKRLRREAQEAEME